MTWKECLEEFNAINVKTDNSKMKSLIITAHARIAFFENQKINEQSCNFILEDYYSSVIEILHAILIKEGFKVKNHICLGFYLKDILKREELYRLFDTNRKRRNRLVYYGELVNFETAKKSITELKKLIFELKKLIKKVKAHDRT